MIVLRNRSTVDKQDKRILPAFLVVGRQCKQVLELEPRSQRALYLIGLISYYRQEFQQAEEALEAAAAIGPNTYVLSALADLMEDTGRDEEAARLRRQAIDADSGPASDEE